MLFLLHIASWLILGNPVLASGKIEQVLLGDYLKLQKQYSNTACRPGVEKQYNELDLKYRGDGNYIPVTLDQKVDHKTIKAALPLIKEKIIWIKVQEANIANIKNFSEISQTITRLENEVSLLQEAKKDYFLANTKEAKADIEEKSKKQFSQMMKEVELLRNSAPFLLSFKFPLNHLALRAEYEKYKNLSTKEARSKANSLYLNRRMLQDGSYDENLTRNDSVIRAAFDTLYISLYKEKNRSFLTELERSDFKYVLTNFQNLLENGQDKLGDRFKEWALRAERSLAFYQDIADGKKVKLRGETASTDAGTIIEERSQALFNLKDFVLKKEAEAFAFWSKQSDINQYLYVLETILYAEVGRIDAPDALERRDVAQVVINRYSHPTYSVMTSSDSLYEYLPKDTPIKESKWLNVLFKEGEFSFTYFYIPGNFHIYCPDMSKSGQFLRRENIRIAISLLGKPRKNFKALRYFSRMSMYGRIEMDTLWDDYKGLGEVPGKPLQRPKGIAKLYKQDRYKYLYNFYSADRKKSYLVVEIKGRTYVVDYNNPKLIYNYRNPNQFRYFAPIK
jgi:polyhydroxyalkanoate synthesis regulator phasin